MTPRNIKPAQRALIQALLRKHNARDVVAMLSNSLSGPISYSSVDVIRSGMVSRGELAARQGVVVGHQGLYPEEAGLAAPIDALGPTLGSQRLLERQIAAGQVFGTSMARWQARHGA